MQNSLEAVKNVGVLKIQREKDLILELVCIITVTYSTEKHVSLRKYFPIKLSLQSTLYLIISETVD